MTLRHSCLRVSISYSNVSHSSDDTYLFELQRSAGCTVVRTDDSTVIHTVRTTVLSSVWTTVQFSVRMTVPSRFTVIPRHGATVSFLIVWSFSTCSFVNTPAIQSDAAQPSATNQPSNPKLNQPTNQLTNRPTNRSTKLFALCGPITTKSTVPPTPLLGSSQRDRQSDLNRAPEAP